MLQSPPNAFKPSLGSQPHPNAVTSADQLVSGTQSSTVWTAFLIAGSQSQAQVLASEKCCSFLSPHDVCAAQPGFLRALLTGCRPHPRAAGSRGHGEGRQPLAGGPVRLSNRQQPGGSGEGTQATPPLAGDAAGRASHCFKRGRRGLRIVGGGRGLLETGKGKRGPGAGDKVQPLHKGRSGRTKASAAAQPLPGGWQARRFQTASKETVAHSVQTGCGPKQRWAFHTAQRSANAKLKETAQVSSSSPPDTNSLLESNHFSQQDVSLEPNVSSTLRELRRVRLPPLMPKQTAADVAPAMCERNLLPHHSIQDKGPDTVSGATLEQPGEGRNCVFLNG